MSKKTFKTHTHPFNSPFSGTTQVSRYQKGKNNLDFTEARDSEWQWNQLGHMQVCISLQTDNHASTPLLSFLQAGCPSCRPTNSVKALKATERKPSKAHNKTTVRNNQFSRSFTKLENTVSSKTNKVLSSIVMKKKLNTTSINISLGRSNKTD